MNRYLLLTIFLFSTVVSLIAQTKVSGYVFDEKNEPVAFASVLFKNSTTGTISNEDGRFYLESSDNWDTLSISFIGYQTVELELFKKVNYDVKIILKEVIESLDEVVIITGKQSKKNNPAIDILRKIWERKRELIRSELAEKLNTKKENIMINFMKSGFGSADTVGYAKVYKSVKDAEAYEKKHVLKRNNALGGGKKSVKEEPEKSAEQPTVQPEKKKLYTPNPQMGEILKVTA